MRAVTPMDMWFKIGTAVLLLMMIVYLLPRAKIMLQQSREAKADWGAVILPLALVVGFVVLLIAMVR